MNRAALLIALTLAVKFAQAADVQWTRLRGTVKGINLKDQTVTIENRDHDLLTIPVDYQVDIEENHGEKRGLKTLRLDEKITLIDRKSVV